MKNKLFYLLLLILLIAGGSLFYWFQVRPTQIRRECSKYPDRTADGRKYVGSNLYLNCLHQHGLE